MTLTRVLLTGGAGFIGGHLARSLVADGVQVHVVDDLSSGDPGAVPPEAELHELDLADRDAITRLPAGRFDAVLHLAGQSSGERSFDDPLRDHDANARSTLLLAAWALERDVPALVHASSMGVYGEASAHPVAEDADTRPISWYGTSKLAAERVLAMAALQGLRTVSLRMFSVYGPGQDLAEMRQGMVSIYLAQLLRGDELHVRGSLDRVRDFVYVDDVVAAWRLAAAREVSGPLNLGSGVGTRIGGLVERLVALCALPADHPVRVESDTPGDQFALSADVSRARAKLGWEPRTSLDAGLQAMVRWARGTG